MNYKIALAGNPNVGKTTLYNRLTKSLENAGNWHGVTVDIASKSFVYKQHKIVLDDLPGFYSFTTCSFEEEVCKNALLKREYDLIINICDVNNLARNLCLTLQLIEAGLPIVVAVNMTDELKFQGAQIDYAHIEKSLGICIVPISAKYNKDISKLLDAALNNIQNSACFSPAKSYLKDFPLSQCAAIIADKNKNINQSKQWCALKVLENDQKIVDDLKLSQSQIDQIAALGNFQTQIAYARFDFIGAVLERAVKRNALRQSKNPLFALDKIALNKFLAIPFFLCVMLSIFYLTFALVGKLASEGLEYLINDLLKNALRSLAQSATMPDWSQSLLLDAIVGGVGGVLAFLPQVVLLFFFLALLEDTGYLARAAFISDGFFRKIGLSGRSVFTMLMGFGCTATAVLTARNQDDAKTRIKTILLTPFMSCGAKMPVYTTIAAAYFAKGAPLIIFLLYLLGVAVAFFWALILNKTKKLKSKTPAFIMEIPPYRLPSLDRVLKIILQNTKLFLLRVASVVFVMTVFVWFLSSFSPALEFVSGGEQKSILQNIATFIAPVFIPLGFGSWQAVTGILSGLVAKEAVVSALNTVAGAAGIGSIFGGQYAQAAAFSYLVFVLLYSPCIAAVGSTVKEAGKKAAVFSVCLQTITAYAASAICYLVGVVFCSLSAGVVAAIIIALIILVYSVIIVTMTIRKKKCKKVYCAGCTLPCQKR